MLADFLPEIWGRLSMYCSLVELKRVARTCSQCNSLLKPFLHHTIGVPTDTMSSDPLALQVRLPALILHTQTLRIRGASIPGESIGWITQITNLKDLNLKFSDLTDLGLSMICRNLKLLEVLNVSKSLVTDQGMQFIQQLSVLQELILHKCQITGIGFNFLVEVVTLRKLDVSGCVGISDSGLVRLNLLSKLLELNLADCPQFMDAGFLHLRKLASLEKLNLYRCGLSDDAFSKLVEGLPTLKLLQVKYCPYLSKETILYHEEFARTLDIIS